MMEITPQMGVPVAVALICSTIASACACVPPRDGGAITTTTTGWAVPLNEPVSIISTRVIPELIAWTMPWCADSSIAPPIALMFAVSRIALDTLVTTMSPVSATSSRSRLMTPCPRTPTLAPA